MKEILQLVGTYGLPIVLTIWFVFRIDTIMTKLTNLLEAFIKWQTEKEVERKEREKEMKESVEAVLEQNSAIINQIKILEVKIGK